MAQITNRIRIEVTGDPDETLHRAIGLVTGADPDEVIRSLDADGFAEAPFDPLILTPMPQPLRDIPEVMPEKVDLALAASSKFDLVGHRYRARMPDYKSLPGFMQPTTSREEIERNRHATKTLEELSAWCEREIPEAVRVARLMKIAHRDTGHMEPVTWVRDTVGSPSVGDTVTVEMSGDAVLIGFETGVTAPMPWFRNLAAAIPDDRFMAASWNDDIEYSVICSAEEGALTAVSVGDTEEELLRAKAVVAGKVSQDEPENEPSP